MNCIFVTNRPNYCHKRFAETAGCSFYHIRHFVREDIPLISLPLNGMLNARILPDAEVYFAESIMDYYPIYYKHTKSKKIILIAEDTLSKLNKMSKIKRNYILKMFGSCDGFIAISESSKELLLKYVKKPVEVAYPFPHKEFFHIKSMLGTKNVLFIGRNDKTKGFVELVEAIKILRRADKSWNLYLIGECSKSIKSEDGIHSLGYVKNMDPYMKMCTYFVHPADADFTTPATVFEAMNAGIITIISNDIGQAEIFRKNKLAKLILKDNKPETIAKKLEDFSNRDNKRLSSDLRKLSKDFREEKMLISFKEKFGLLINSI